jgi:hypothetical protein
MSLPVPGHGLLRITVTAGPRRVDLAVPGAVPLVELMPELARSVGMLEGATASGGYRALTATGRELRPDTGLAGQGIEHGHILVVAASVEASPLLVDDPVEAMASIVDDTRAWGRRTARWTRVGVAAVLLLVAAVVLGRQRGGPPTWEDAVVAGSALAATAVFSRARHDPVAGVTAAYVACVYAGAAGWGVGWDASATEAALARAGAGVLLAGLLAASALTRGRSWMLPGLVLGLVALIAGLVATATSVEPSIVLSAVLAVAVLGDAAIPEVALAATGAGRHVLSTPEGAGHRAGACVDLRRLRRDAGRVRELVVVLRTTWGGLLVVLTPAAVSLGPVGAVVPLLGSVVVLARTGRCRVMTDVVVGLAIGVATLLSTAVSLAWLQPGSRPTVGTGLAVVGVAVLLGGLRPAVGGIRTSRWADLAERAALGALVPALLLGVAVFLGRA